MRDLDLFKLRSSRLFSEENRVFTFGLRILCFCLGEFEHEGIDETILKDLDFRFKRVIRFVLSFQGMPDLKK